MAHTFIEELQAGRQIDDIFMVTQPILRSTTRGDLYIAMYLSDRTGRLNCRMWQASEDIYNSLPKEGFVRVWGRAEIYKNALQIVADRVQPIDAEQVRLDDFLPRTSKNVRQMLEETKEIVSSIKNAQLKAIVDEFLADEELMEKFYKAPGGIKLHHDYLGGLLEHTVNMLKVARAVLPFYPEVQADLVLAGIFLHDMGKTEEFSYEMAFSYTDRGQLVGHITQTVLMLQQKVEALRDRGTAIDAGIVDSLEHIILSHHGQYDFGSPKLPATAEAFMVKFIDDMDAKLNQVTRAIENDPGDSDWTEWKRALETRLYRRRVIE